MFQLSGKIIAVLEARSGVSQRGNEWKSQEFVLETFDQYPKHMSFRVFGADKLAEYNIQQGNSYIVDFTVDAREWNGKWFNSIDASKVTALGASVPAGTDPFASQQQPAQGAQPVQAQPAQDNDNVPF